MINDDFVLAHANLEKSITRYNLQMDPFEDDPFEDDPFEDDEIEDDPFEDEEFDEEITFEEARDWHRVNRIIAIII